VSRRALESAVLRGVHLRNRFIKTATYEGMSPGGRVSEALVAHHAQMAANGVALTTVAYAAVSPDGRTFGDQLLVDRDNVPGLRKLTDAVHERGGLASLQLGHCGGFSKNKEVRGGRPAGPSAGWNTYGLLVGVPRIRAMTADEIAQVPKDFAEAARLAQEAGFDAVEVHCGHGYLLSQFLSPAVNRRTDAWGGPLPARARLAVAVIEAVREAVGGAMPILAKLNTRDGVPGGQEMDETVQIAQWLVDAGVDCIVPSGGLVARSPFFLMRGRVPVSDMVRAEKHPAQRWAIRLFAPLVMKPYAYTSNFFLEDAARIAAAVDVPVALLGGVDSAAAVSQAMERGFAFVAMGRALLADPDFIPRLAAGEAVVSRCTHCNACVGEMDRGGVRCVLEPRPA
jgi:2,4-dienoyl-CoA reductase-like NADH-dependent reductase (Old Yellow Enzyme family)